mmetsp:Transcript_79509/g.228181  ORF Transcript_79509/g.228181 Transcript_79509/m.228181 type:complete len:222 (+) Transcript_79509:641-1306(+)
MPDAATDSSSGDFTLTKAPKTDLPSTMPSSHSSVPAKGINFARFTGSAGLGNPADEASLSMLNANLPFSASTLNTRTRTSLPRGAAWATSSMKASAMYLMGTKPLASSWPPPGGFTAMKTPYKVKLTTRPVSHSSGKPAMSSNGESSALNCADSSGWSSFFSFMDKARRLSLIESTRTRTASPTVNAPSGEPSKPALIWVLYTKPFSSSTQPGGRSVTKTP